MTHTPGPWIVQIAPGVPDELEIVATTDRYQVASAWGGLDVGHDDVDANPSMHANAKLIAAAPELLDACRRVVARAADLLNSRSLSPNDVRAIQLAIAKAEGTSL